MAIASSLFFIVDLEEEGVLILPIPRALKDTHFTLFISILSFWGIALPVGYFMATRLDFSGVGLWWGMVVGAGFSVLLLLLRFKSKIKHY